MTFLVLLKTPRSSAGSYAFLSESSAIQNSSTSTTLFSMPRPQWQALLFLRAMYYVLSFKYYLLFLVSICLIRSLTMSYVFLCLKRPDNCYCSKRNSLQLVVIYHLLCHGLDEQILNTLIIGPASSLSIFIVNFRLNIVGCNFFLSLLYFRVLVWKFWLVTFDKLFRFTFLKKLIGMLCFIIIEFSLLQLFLCLL